MSDELFNVMTPFADVAELGQGYMTRADGERLWVPLPIQAIEGEQVQFVIHLLDGVPAFAGAGRCIQVADQGPGVDPSVRFEALLDSLVFDERSQPVYDYIVAVRTAALSEEESYSADAEHEPDGSREAEVDYPDEGAAAVRVDVRATTPSERAVAGVEEPEAQAYEDEGPYDGEEEEEYVDVSADASSVPPDVYMGTAHAVLEPTSEPVPTAVDTTGPGALEAADAGDDYGAEDDYDQGEDPPITYGSPSATAATTLGGKPTVGYEVHAALREAASYQLPAGDEHADTHAQRTSDLPTGGATSDRETPIPPPAQRASAQGPNLSRVESDQLHIPINLAERNGGGRAAEPAQETVINPSIMPIATGILTRPAIALIFRPVRALGPARSASTGQFHYSPGTLPTPRALPRAAALSDGNAALAIAQEEPRFEEAAEQEMAVEFDEEAAPVVVGPEGFMRRRGPGWE